MNQLVPVTNTIKVVSQYVIDGQLVIEVNCEDYQDYKQLPPAVKSNNTRLVKTGWNSDRHYACFKQEKPGQLVDFYA